MHSDRQEVEISHKKQFERQKSNYCGLWLLLWLESTQIQTHTHVYTGTRTHIVDILLFDETQVTFPSLTWDVYRYVTYFCRRVSWEFAKKYLQLTQVTLKQSHVENHEAVVLEVWERKGGMVVAARGSFWRGVPDNCCWGNCWCPQSNSLQRSQRTPCQPAVRWRD